MTASGQAHPANATTRLSLTHIVTPSTTLPDLLKTVSVQDTMRGMLLGNITLSASGEQMTEACLELLSSPALDGKTAAFENFSNIQWTRVNRRRLRTPLRAADTLDDGLYDSNGDAEDSSMRKDISSAEYEQEDSRIAAKDAIPVPVAVPAPGLNLSGRYSWVRSIASAADSSRSSNAEDDWTAVRLRNGWTDGQHVLESMFSPYDSEGIEDCREELRAACRPPL
jgi:hypothetical protein